MRKIILYTNLILLCSLALATVLSLVVNILTNTFDKGQVEAAYTIQPIVSLTLMGIAYLNFNWLLRRMNIFYSEPPADERSEFYGRLARLPLVVASLIMVYSIIRSFIVTTLLFIIAALNGQQFIAIWLVVIITSLTVSIIAFVTAIVIMGRLTPGKRPLPRVTALPSPTLLFNMASILVPNAAILVAIYLYDVNKPDLEIDLGLFVIVAIIFSGIFILIQLIRASIGEAADVCVEARDLSDVFIKKYRITDREKEIIMMLLNGLSNREIAKSMNCSEKTIKNHLYNIYKKTGVSSRAKLLKLITG